MAAGFQFNTLCSKKLRNLKMFSHFIIVTQKVAIIKWYWIFKFLNFLLNKMETRRHAVIIYVVKSSEI